jgi:hypothetical protein
VRKWRKMTWAIIVWCSLILIWAVAGGGSAASDCADQTGDAFLSAQDAQDACNAGAGIGVALILFVGFFGFVFLALIWFMTRPKTRACPRCGNDVKKGVMACRSCGFDFQTMGSGTTSAPAASP